MTFFRCALWLSFVAVVSCERHSWEETKKLYDHGDHGVHTAEAGHREGEKHGEAGVAEEGHEGHGH